MSQVATPVAKARGSSVLFRIALREEELEHRLAAGLGRVEERLLECAARAADPRVAEVVGYLVAAGGKRLRPLLTLVAAEFAEPGAPGVVDAAVISELVHVASLYHDDVMDQARIRHGVPSVNVRWGDCVAVRAGNWLLATSARLSAGLVAQTLPLHAEASERLVRGQMRELLGPDADDDPLAHYFSVVSDKSAALMSLALRLGALQAGAPASVADVLAEYGEHLGVAFQIADDLLDITSPSALSGKEQGKDLAVGVACLPVLLVRAGDDPRDDELRALLGAPSGLAGAAHQRALELLRRSPAMARARSLMEERLVQARSVLDRLPPGPPSRALDALCDVVARRTGQLRPG
ncbi:polyprenyl synthetase family protein [Streptomyces actinomycinicus]|uniref:Polyprenyl synthetase family protein n=1 Tax=Streptomyces actinomycinicus TaxID=1695166 RepID=A0A937JMD5_9ACTN|nr:polyprenyl synthetase family protein [Streptomyces actinomycinicus]MBL1081177.1 polyprenyl synthetase family protein [Streptomyces actinomycinicus]